MMIFDRHCHTSKNEVASFQETTSFFSLKLAAPT